MAESSRAHLDLEERRLHQSWNGLLAVLTVGDLEVPCRVAGEPRWEFGSLDEVTVRAPAWVAALGLRFLSKAQLSVRFDDGIEPVLAGHVSVVACEPETVLMTMAGLFSEMKTSRIGGMAVKSGFEPGTVAPLISLLLARTDIGLDQSGLGPDSSDDLMVVLIPVDGINAEPPFLAGQAVFVSDRRVAELAAFENVDPELVLRFQETSSWATVILAGDFEYELQVRANRLVDAAIAWIMMTHSTGLSSIGDIGPLPFRREWTRSRPKRRGIVLLCGDRTGRRLLKGDGWNDLGPPLGGRDSTRLPELSPAMSQEPLLEALLAWRRGVEASDHYGACAAFCEAIECAVASVKVEPMFNSEQKRNLRAQLSSGLDGARLERIEQMIDGLNSPSLIHRVQAVAEQRGIEIKPADFDAFRRVRKARNDFVHGGVRTDVDPADLNCARVWVGEFLMRLVLGEPGAKAQGLIRISPSTGR